MSAYQTPNKYPNVPRLVHMGRVFMVAGVDVGLGNMLGLFEEGTDGWIARYISDPPGGEAFGDTWEQKLQTMTADEFIGYFVNKINAWFGSAFSAGGSLPPPVATPVSALDKINATLSQNWEIVAVNGVPTFRHK